MSDQPPKRNIGKIHSYYDHMTSLNYKETPVDIITFLRNEHFIGLSTNNGKAIYPGWYDPIQEIFYNDNKYLVVLTGSIGIGKSTIAIYCMAYILYKVFCLRDPHLYFKLAGTDTFAVSFFNLTKSLGDSRGFQKLMNVLMLSPWFREHGGVIRGKDNQYMDLPLYSWKLSSPYTKGFGVVGEDVLLGIMDEVDDPSAAGAAKERVLKAYEATARRFESRFVYDQESISRFFLVSSKQDELSFLETFVEDMKGSDRVLVIDKKQWEIKPKSGYSGTTFPVLVGDAYTPSRIVTDTERIDLLKESKTVEDIPIELLFDFERDIIGALRDLAGITVRGIRKYKLFPSERFVTECFVKELPNPLAQETIEIGLKDDIELIALFNMKNFRTPLSDPRFIHMDISLSGDCLGLAMSSVAGWTEKDIEQPDGTFLLDAVPIIQTDFSMRFRARAMDEIPLHKMRKLILDLRARGLNIKMFTADLKLASADTTQILMASQIECEYFSLDRNVQPYLDFKNMVFEKRWQCHWSEVLNFELTNLEHDRSENKIDHPKEVKKIEVLENGEIRRYNTEGSKDMADAVAGSVWMAAKMALKPVNIVEAIGAMAERRKNQTGGVPATFSGDWFIDTGKTDKDGNKETVLVREPDQVQQMINAIKKHKQRRPFG